VWGALSSETFRAEPAEDYLHDEQPMGAGVTGQGASIADESESLIQ